LAPLVGFAAGFRGCAATESTDVAACYAGWRRLGSSSSQAASKTAKAGRTIVMGVRNAVIDLRPLRG
jgi:hypothetical protein